jgi:hypothetical protein
LKAVRFSVMAGQKREARLRARCPGHPRLLCGKKRKTWMPGTSPGMTVDFQKIMLKQRDEIVTRSNLIGT